MIFFIILVLIVVGLVLLTRAESKKQKLKKANMEQRGAVDYFTAAHVEGLGLSNGAFCDIIQFDDHLLIESGESKFHISLNKVRAAVVKTERELKEQNKSVVGRAVIGTLLVPGLGTIVGGMSGVGSKKKKGNLNTYFIINYENSRGDLDAATFLNNYNPIKIGKFCASINNAANGSRSGQTIQL